MKILHVTHRFGKDIIGGAENYLWNLSTHLARRGIDVTIATTTARDFHSPTRWNNFWSQGYPPGEEITAGLRILRFPFRNNPKWLAALYGIPLERRFASEEWGIEPPSVHPVRGGFLGRGWYFEERIGNLTQRWIGSRAEIFICDDNIREVGFTAQCPWGNSGEVFLNGEGAGEFSITKDYGYFSFKLRKPVDSLKMDIRLRRTKRPWRELRKLGIAVSDISYKAGERTESIPLHRHYASTLHRQKDALLNWLERRARSRPARLGRKFDLARGPISPALLRYLKTHTGEYDLILGHNFPNPSLCWAIRAGRAAGIATAALPLAHLEDDYYHWQHYYDALADADVTFALSDYSRDIFRAHFGANAHTLGGGIDLKEFQNAEFNGERFRKEHSIGDVPFVLFVGRKSYTKRYDALMRAMRIVNQKRPCRLVMIGPDQDGQAINPTDALYLGEQSRQTILDSYDACDIFAMLSESESFGMVFTEAWMLKKPVIGYKYCGAVASLISDGKDGFLCDSDEEVAQRILLLLNEPSLAERLGESGRQKTLANYTWDKIAAKAHRHYEAAIEK